MSTSAEKWLTAPDGHEFYTKTWTPAPDVPTVAQVVFVHGFVEHIKRYELVFDHFASQGIATFAYDQRGFGETGAKSKSLGSTSWKHALSDVSYFINLVATDKTPLFLLGHSMGGALSLAFGTRSPALPGLEKLRGIISAAPLIRQAPGVKAPALLVKAGSFVGMVLPNMQIKTAVKAADVCRDPVIQAAYSADPLCSPVGSYKGVADMLLGGEGLITKDYKDWPAHLPLLVLHGSGDLVTDHDASAEFVRKVVADGKEASFKSYDGFYHELHNEPADDKWKVINDWSAWIKSKL